MCNSPATELHLCPHAGKKELCACSLPYPRQEPTPALRRPGRPTPAALQGHLQLEWKIGLPWANTRGSLKFLSFSRIPMQLEKNEVVPCGMLVP